MNKKTLFSFIIFFFSISSISAQQQSVIATVLDSATKLPLNAVYIHNINNSKYTSTDKNGEADISFFAENDTLIFQRSNYKSLRFTISDLEKKSFRILLPQAVNSIAGVTIFANKWEQKSREFPYITRKMKSAEIKDRQYLSSGDILGSMDEVFLQKSQNGGGSPMIRGFAANGVLIVVNNVRMNNAIFRGGNLQNVESIHPYMIDKMEVIYGPGSVTYGSDALGGVMDFHLKKAMLSGKKKANVKVDYTGMVSSSPSAMNHNFDLNLGFKKFASRSVFSFYTFSNVYAGKKHFGAYPEFGKRKWVQSLTSDGKDTVYENPQDNRLIPSYYNSFSVLQNFFFKAGEHLDISYDFVFSNTSDIQRYDKLTIEKNGLPKYALWYYGPQKWILNNLRIKYDKGNKFFDEVKTSLAFQQFEESRHDRKFNNDWQRNRTEKVNVYSLNTDFNKQFTSKLSLYYGLALNLNDVKSEAYQENKNTGETKQADTRYPNGSNTYFSSEIYADGKYKFSPDLTFMAGLRLSYISLNSSWLYSSVPLPDPIVNMKNYAPNGSIGIAWLPLKKLQINAHISTGFRAPNLDDVSKMFDSEPGKVTVPNDNLKPEYAYTAELSAAYKILENLSLAGSGFFTYIDNKMVRRNYTLNGQDSIIYDGEMSRVQAIVNAANGKIYGCNFNFKFKPLNSLTLTSSLTFMKGYDNEGHALRHVPPAFGNTFLKYDFKRMHFELFSYYSGGIAFDKLAPEEQGKAYLYPPDGAEPWYTINFRYTMKFKHNFNLAIGLYNLLDRFYIPYASGIPAPGRHFQVTLNIHF